MLRQLFKFTGQEKLQGTLAERMEPLNKTGTTFKTLTPNKLLTRLVLLLAQIKI